MSLKSQLKQVENSIRISIEGIAQKYHLKITRATQIEKIIQYKTRFTANILLEPQNYTKEQWREVLNEIQRAFDEAIKKDIKLEKWTYFGSSYTSETHTKIAVSFIFEIPKKIFPKA